MCYARGGVPVKWDQKSQYCFCMEIDGVTRPPIGTAYPTTISSGTNNHPHTPVPTAPTGPTLQYPNKPYEPK